MLYIPRPITIEAIQFTGNVEEIINFTNVSDIDVSYKEGRWSCIINTPVAKFLVLETDYIIKTETNELIIMNQDTFEKTYMTKE